MRLACERETTLVQELPEREGAPVVRLCGEREAKKHVAIDV